MYLEQAVEAERTGLDPTSLTAAVSEYNMEVRVHPGDTMKEMDDALMMADDWSEASSVQGITEESSHKTGSRSRSHHTSHKSERSSDIDPRQKCRPKPTPCRSAPKATGRVP